MAKADPATVGEPTFRSGYRMTSSRRERPLDRLSVSGGDEPFPRRIGIRVSSRLTRITGIAGMYGLLRRDVDFGSAQKIIEAADAVPPVSIAFDHKAMAAALVGAAVVFRQKVDQQLAMLGVLALEAD